MATASPSHTPKGPTALPTPRSLIWLLLRELRNLNLEEAALVNTLYEAAPDARAMAELARNGSAALRNRDPAMWQKWSQEVANSECRDLARFLAGVTCDQAALANALNLPFSNGPTEGHVNRVELFKRSTNGRASFGLLRNKILHQTT